LCQKIYASKPELLMYHCWWTVRLIFRTKEKQKTDFSGKAKEKKLAGREDDMRTGKWFCTKLMTKTETSKVTTGGGSGNGMQMCQDHSLPKVISNENCRKR